jgi:uncharacterized protein (DUF58 family)
MKWLLGFLFLLLAALLLESGLLAYSMYVLLALLLLSRLLTTTWIASLTATRQCDASEIEAGDSVSVHIKVKNHGVFPVLWLLLEDLLPARTTVDTRKRLRVKKKRLKMALLPPGSSTEMPYEVQFRKRGYYQIGPLVLETGDLFGLHRRYHVATEPHFVLVYPLVVPLEGYDISSRRPIGEIRLVHRLFEDPTRIAGVRPYEQGDPLNRVHWRATARTGTLHCKQYEPSTIAGATIMLDFHEDGYPPAQEPERSELAITTAASLAFALYQTGEQLGFITNGRDAADRIRQEGWEHDFRTRKAALKSIGKQQENTRLQPLIVPTNRGVEQFQQIWATLARVELTDGLTFPQLLTEASSRLPRNATVIAILSKATDETAIALGHLRRRGFAVVAVLIIVDDAELEEAQIRLRAEGVEVRHVRDEATLMGLCQRAALR